MKHDQKIARALYKRLLALYPRAFREQLGESMAQTFNDRYNERKRQAGQGLFGFVLWMFIETGIGIAKERALVMRQGGAMKMSLTKPRSAAIVGLLLCLPFTIVLSLLMLNIEPNFGPLEPLLTNPDPDQPDLGGSLLILGLFLLLPVAFFIVRAPIRQTLRTGGSLFAHPIHLALAVAILAVIAFVVGSIIVDQYPCWIGVPNCD